MPIYEYRCGNCAHELEALQKISEPPLALCPACNREALVKKVSAAGFQLKGSGWYATDFRNGNSGSKPASADAKSDATGDAKADAPKTDGAKSDAPAATTTATASAGGCGSGCACH